MTPQRSPMGTGGGGSSGGGGGGPPALHYLSGPYGDTTFTKVFVGGLAWETRSEGLRAHFEVYGDILEAVVITDRATGRSKGYGFVSTPSSCFFLSFVCAMLAGVFTLYFFHWLGIRDQVRLCSILELNVVFDSGAGCYHSVCRGELCGLNWVVDRQCQLAVKILEFGSFAFLAQEFWWIVDLLPIRLRENSYILLPGNTEGCHVKHF
jgi:hypothetical protein